MARKSAGFHPPKMRSAKVGHVKAPKPPKPPKMGHAKISDMHVHAHHGMPSQTHHGVGGMKPHEMKIPKPPKMKSGLKVHKSAGVKIPRIHAPKPGIGKSNHIRKVK